MDIKKFGFNDFESENEPAAVNNTEVESNYKLESLLDEIDDDIADGYFVGDDIVQGARDKLKRIVDECPRDTWGQNARFYWAKVRIDYEIADDDVFIERFTEIAKDPSYKRAKKLSEVNDEAVYSQIQSCELLVAEHIEEMEKMQKAKIEAERQAEEQRRLNAIAEEARQKAEAERKRAEALRIQEEEKQREIEAERMRLKALEDEKRRLEEKRKHDFEIPSWSNHKLWRYHGDDEVVEIPSEVTEIHEEAFDRCKNVKKIILHDGMSKIDGSAFSRCKSLECIVIPDSVITIGSYAFNECENLTEIILPEYLVEIGQGAFKKCKKLKSIVIPSGVEKIEKYTFEDCESLKSVILPDGLKEIDDKAFHYCRALLKIEFPNSLKEIGQWAFYGCHSLTNVYLPDALGAVGYEAFRNCNNLKKVSVGGNIYHDSGIPIMCKERR